jgi:type I restriction enzyme S subunit
MEDKWKETTLGDLVTFQSGGTPSKGNASYWNGAIPWVSAKDMKQLFLDDSEDHVTELGAENGTKLIPPNTVLMLARGMTLLNDVPICIVRKPMTFNQDVKALHAKGDLYGGYLPYLLLGNKPRLLSMVDLAGHGTGRLNTEELKRLSIQVPPPSEQQAIACILRALDDKIDLNRRRNCTLEAMARATFQSWFVDFDPVRAKAEGRTPTGLSTELAALFPSSFEESELGDIPKGWRVGAVQDIVSISRDAIVPGEHPEEVFDHYSIPAYDAGQNPSQELGETIKSQKFGVVDDCVLVSKLNPKTPRIWIPEPNGERRRIASTEFLVCQPLPESGIGRAYFYCLSRDSAFCDYLTSRASGTSNSHQRVRPDDFRAYKTSLPPRALADQFEAQAEPLLERVLLLKGESGILAALRDALLPKLISGELRVPDAERIVGRAM